MNQLAMNQPAINYLQPPPQIPEPGAVAYGQDNYGYWQEFTVGEVTQRFRWIHPGSFLMGSPEDEPERVSWEAQTPVTLTQGFWLADTAVSQNLWQAVMGENPSEFKHKNAKPGQQFPVEQVSWEDCQAFINKLNQAHNWHCRLPYEAEWEYACRAGTEGPFSFGANITPKLVNYRGTAPYNGSAEGEFRETTVALKSLPRNKWGLYEMHGNVWEWCQDWWQQELATLPQVDPTGPARGEKRSLRGGSWFGYASGCRSACRDYCASPGDRSDYVGFRLARAQFPGW